MALYAGILASFSQSPAPDTSAYITYNPRKLRFEEVNFVSSYYIQDGNHASVTGGLGTQELTDFANVIDVKVYTYDRKNRKHQFNLGCGIDNYSSASSDMIDLSANSSASSSDMRVYPSLTWLSTNEKKGLSYGAGLYFSTEYDYKSFGAEATFGKKTSNRNGELNLKLQVYLDQVKLIYPVELRHAGADDIDLSKPSEARNSYSMAASWSQEINPRLQVLISAEIIQQSGFLSLPFHRVYFTDQSVHAEKLPDMRLKIPLGLRLSYFLGDRIIMRLFYRYYTDDWNLSSNTAGVEIPVKLNTFFSISPFYRFYAQHAARYFSPYETHEHGVDFYTSNYDLSQFTSHFMGAGLRYTPLHGLFGLKYLNMIEVRYGLYDRSDGLKSSIVSLNLLLK